MLNINLFEFHVSKEGTWGITILLINGRSLFEIWRGKFGFWMDVFFVRVLDTSQG